MATPANWKTPPKAKVYEALSAVADGRVTIVNEGEASVASSDAAKTYTVVWTPDRTAFGANDNASYWVGYIGYPIIATVFALGVVEYDKELAKHLAGVNWNKLNQAYKRKYDEAVDYVLAQIDSTGGPAGEIRNHADALFSALKTLKLGRINPPGAPPKKP
ncbi:MAG TPA: hypothetical protein VGF97_13425 [Rhizomicrobium sp.]|jgi:hypothetical protein